MLDLKYQCLIMLIDKLNWERAVFEQAAETIDFLFHADPVHNSWFNFDVQGSIQRLDLFISERTDASVQRRRPKYNPLWDRGEPDFCSYKKCPVIIG
mmetsp:Transcript_18129/g.29337  ORF Transcript_18129/g.29337 Transcript_18129/m.29337 type:complete len:97 (-) Transcript_18129:29-319(-)